MTLVLTDTDRSASISDLAQVSQAVLFTDIVDSVRLVEADEEAAIGRWLKCIARIEAEILPTLSGRLVKSLGDGLLMAFENASAGARAAFAIQDLMDEVNAGLDPSRQMHLRMGLDIGEVYATAESDLMGRRVNMAARLLTLAKPGEIVATASVRDQLFAELDAEFEDMGDCYLRNMPAPVRAFRMRRPGSQPPLTHFITEADLLPTVAVVPLAPRNPEADHATLGEVLADDIIHTLSQSEGMNVISRLSTTGFRMRGSAEAEIGEALRAQFVVTGAYTRRNGGVQVDMKLTDARSGLVLWSRRLHAALDDFVLDPAILAEIAGDIQRAIVRQEVRRALSSPMPNLASYTLLMAAVALMHRLSPDEFELSRRMLKTLIDRSSHNPTAQAWMAKWHVLRVQQGWTDSPEREASQARLCTEKALASDPTNVPALVAEGFVLNNLMRRLDEAEERYDAALAQSPNDAMGRLLRGTLYAFRGEGEAAMRDTERALLLAPRDPHRFFFHSLAASACIAAENYPRALDLATRSLRSNRAHTSTLRVKAVAEMRLGLGDAARETARELMRRQPDLTVSKWLKSAPSADYPVGQAFARTLQEAGVPE